MKQVVFVIVRTYGYCLICYSTHFSLMRVVCEAGGEAEAGAEDGASGVGTFQIQAMEQGIGVGSLLQDPDFHAVGGFVEEGQLKAVHDVCVVGSKVKPVEEQICVADRIDVAVFDQLLKDFYGADIMA